MQKLKCQRGGGQGKEEERERESQKSWTPLNSEPTFSIAQLSGLEQGSFQLHDGKCQAARGLPCSPPAGWEALPAMLLSWQSEVEPEIWLLNVVIRSCVGMLW